MLGSVLNTGTRQVEKVPNAQVSHLVKYSIPGVVSAYCALGSATIAAILLPFQGLVNVFHLPPLPINDGWPIAVMADRLCPRLGLVMSGDMACLADGSNVAAITSGARKDS